MVSDGGLFELRADGAIRRLPAPFVTGGLPSPAIAESPGNRAVLVLAQDGLFAIRAEGHMERVPGGQALRPGFIKAFLGEIPVSRDQFLLASNALYLVVGTSSPRWTPCRAATHPGADSPA